MLGRIARSAPWQAAVDAVQRAKPDSAGNGSVMRCWPVALAHWDDLDRLLADSRLQSRVTHPHPECVAGSVFVNATIHHLVHGVEARAAVGQALDEVAMPSALRQAIEAAPTKRRDALPNSGWVRHTVESAIWGLLTTDSFEEAVVQVVNLGNDADTAGAVAGALAGAAYGLQAIPRLGGPPSTASGRSAAVSVGTRHGWSNWLSSWRELRHLVIRIGQSGGGTIPFVCRQEEGARNRSTDS